MARWQDFKSMHIIHGSPVHYKRKNHKFKQYKQLNVDVCIHAFFLTQQNYCIFFSFLFWASSDEWIFFSLKYVCSKPKTLRIVAASKFMNRMDCCCCFTLESSCWLTWFTMYYFVSFFLLISSFRSYGRACVVCVYTECRAFCIVVVFSLFFSHSSKYSSPFFLSNTFFLHSLFIIFSCCWSSHFIIASSSASATFLRLLLLQCQCQCICITATVHLFPRNDKKIRKLVKNILQHLQTKFHRFWRNEDANQTTERDGGNKWANTLNTQYILFISIHVLYTHWKMCLWSHQKLFVLATMKKFKWHE